MSVATRVNGSGVHLMACGAGFHQRGIEVRKLIVACVAALALTLTIVSCSSSKPSKGAFVDTLKSGGSSESVAQCIADKTYDRLSAKALKANDISPDNVKLIETVTSACQAASGSTDSGSTSN